MVGESFLALEQVTLAIIIGTLGAIVYLLRIMVVMEKRVARMDYNLERIIFKVLKEETVIEKEESTIARKKKKKSKKRRR